MKLTEYEASFGMNAAYFGADFDNESHDVIEDRIAEAFKEHAWREPRGRGLSYRVKIKPHAFGVASLDVYMRTDNQSWSTVPYKCSVYEYSKLYN